MKTILIVDDEPNICRLVEYNLQKEFNVVTATNGREAFDLLDKGTDPDLVIADVMMPLMDGFQLLDAMRKDPRFVDVPLMFLSAKSQSADRIKGLQLGAEDYLIKPFNVAELHLRVDHILKRAAK